MRDTTRQSDQSIGVMVWRGLIRSACYGEPHEENGQRGIVPVLWQVFMLQAAGENGAAGVGCGQHENHHDKLRSKVKNSEGHPHIIEVLQNAECWHLA